MIKGMTGFGSAELTTKDFKVSVEVKTLNHRYFDISYYLPSGFSFIENKIRQIVQKTIERGRITVAVKFTQKNTQTVNLNKEILKKHIQYTKNISKEFGLKNDLTLSDLIRLPGVLETKDAVLDPDHEWTNVEKCLHKAVADLAKMRISEGKSLALDVKRNSDQMFMEIKKIQARIKVILAEKRKQLTNEEFSNFQKNVDINEEISRLSHYIDEANALLKSNTSVGKRMDFIAQEMQRETNTMGSKIQDKIISNGIIHLKSRVEKIREQAQNIE